jgi:Domain of unknown function (DUF3387)
VWNRGQTKPPIPLFRKLYRARRLLAAFFKYTAVANSDSVRELMQHDQLRELAVVLTQRVRENATIDWTIKENVRVKLKVIVKRTLRQYGYQPDMQLLVTETVLKHAEMIANELGNSLTMPQLEYPVLVCGYYCPSPEIVKSA